MKERQIILLIPLFVVWNFLVIIEAQRNVDTCSIFPDGTKLRHPQDCAQEIKCNNSISVNGTKCIGSKPFYNKDTYKCETHLEDNSTCSIDCSTWSGKFVKDPKSCYGYYYCQNNELAQYGHCESDLHFNQTSQACVHAEQSGCDRSKLNYCAIVSTGVKFKDVTNCGRYYECVLNKRTRKIELTNLYCPATAVHFNAAKGICQSEPTSACKPVPQNVCGVGKKVKRKYFVSDGATCQGSFYCDDFGTLPDPNPKHHQCSGNKFFSEDKQKCLDPKDVVCLRDRCQGSKRVFVTSHKSGCRNYLICENGRTVSETTCGNLFFDEEKQHCTPEIVKYPACFHP